MTGAELAHMEGVALDDVDRRAVSAYWDRVISECEAAAADGPVPSAWLRSAGERRAVRRLARRVRVAAVRSLPVRMDNNGQVNDGVRECAA